MVWCSRCEIGHTDVTRVTSLESYYPPAYYGQGDRRFVGVVEGMIKLSRHMRARYVMRFRDFQSRRLLDHGCGRGIMLAYLRSREWTCVGTEFSAKASEYARKTGLTVVTPSDGRDALDLVEGPFGVVSAWHVLEHLDDPARSLRRFYDLLEPGGQVVLEVPNFSSVQAQLGPGDWLYTECPRHLVHFSPRSLSRLLAETGFEVRALSTFSIEYGIFGLLQSLLNVFCPTKNLLFHLLRNRSAGAKPLLGSLPALISLGTTAVLVVPLLMVAAIGEVWLALLKKGGVVRVVAQKGTVSHDAGPPS